MGVLLLWEALQSVRGVQEPYRQGDVQEIRFADTKGAETGGHVLIEVLSVKGA